MAIYIITSIMLLIINLSLFPKVSCTLQTDFFSTLDVFPYKSCAQNLLAAFENITSLVWFTMYFIDVFYHYQYSIRYVIFVLMLPTPFWF